MNWIAVWAASFAFHSAALVIACLWIWRLKTENQALWGKYRDAEAAKDALLRELAMRDQAHPEEFAQDKAG